MPALRAIISGDSTPLMREMAKVEAMANGTARRMNSTVFNATPKISAEAGYADWWAKAIKEQEQAAKDALSTARKNIGVQVADITANVVRGGKTGGGHAKFGGESAREAMTVVRELAGGNFSRAATSAGVLLQKLMSLSFLLNPLTIAAGAFLGILYLLDKGMKALAPKADNLGIKSLTQAFEGFQERADQARLAAQAFFDELARGRNEVDKLSESLQHKQDVARAATESDNMQAEAQKALALAELERDKNQGKMSPAEYAKKKADIENKADEEALKRKREARGTEIANSVSAAMDAEKLYNEKLGEVKGKQDEAARAKELKEENDQRIQRLKENLKVLAQEKNKGGEEGMRASTEYWRQYRVLQFSTEQKPDLDLDAQRKEAEKNNAEKEVSGLKVQAEKLRRDADSAHERNNALRPGEDAKLAADKKRREIEMAQAVGTATGVSLAGPITQNQRLGAYISPIGASQLQVQKDIHHEIKGLRDDIKNACQNGRPPIGGVQY